MDSLSNEIKIPKRILNTLLTSLSAGVVPRIGTPYIAIGREDEITSLLGNLDDVADGGAACRFLIGRYGSGKPVIGILGEFDALSGLSQVAGSCEHTPVTEGGCGHAAPSASARSVPPAGCSQNRWFS